MIAKPGATSANNWMARGLVHVDPNVNAQETQGLVMRSDVVVDSVDFLKSPARSDTLFPEVKIRIRGRVRALECANLPGYEGSVVKFFFGKPKHIESGDDVIEHSADARPSADLDTTMPQVTILNKLELEQLYMLGAKGGFVKGYEIDAARALNDQLVSRTLIKVPLSVTYFNAAPYVEFVNIEHPHDNEIETKNLGYDLVKFCPISEEMSKSPEKVVEDEPEHKVAEVESISVADVYEQGLVDLETEQEAEPELAEVAETQAEAESGMPAYIGPQGYTAEDHIRNLDEDEIAVHDILAQIRGEVTDAAQKADEPSVQVTDRVREADDQQSRDGEFVLDDAADIFAAESDGRGAFESAGDTQAESDPFATIDLPLDDIDDVLGLGDEGVSEGERAHRADVKAAQNAALMNMGNDGADSISAALTNAESAERTGIKESEPDPRFADEFDGLDI